MSKTFVFIFHKGTAPYLQKVIDCAVKSGNEVVLAGDMQNKQMNFVRWINAEEYISATYTNFLTMFEQYSKYSYEFDTICFQRFFVMQKYMEKENLEDILFLDSDALLYINATKIFHEHGCKAALSMPKEQKNYGWAYCAHCSYWTKEYLDDFLNFVIDTYKGNKKLLKDKWNYHQEHNLQGGVCDMTLLYLWARNKQYIFNICKINGGEVFDNCMASSDNYFTKEYKMKKVLGIKKLVYQNNRPYLITKDGKLVQANVLHCSGAVKSIICNIYENDFSGAIRCRLSDIIKRVIKILRKRWGGKNYDNEISKILD